MKMEECKCLSTRWMGGVGLGGEGLQKELLA